MKLLDRLRGTLRRKPLWLLYGTVYLNPANIVMVRKLFDDPAFGVEVITNSGVHLNVPHGLVHRFEAWLDLCVDVVRLATPDQIPDHPDNKSTPKDKPMAFCYPDKLDEYIAKWQPSAPDKEPQA